MKRLLEWLGGALLAPEGEGSGSSAPALDQGASAPAGGEAAASSSSAAPASDAAPAADAAASSGSETAKAAEGSEGAAVSDGKAAEGTEKAPAKPAEKKNDFAPSLLDEAAAKGTEKPAADAKADDKAAAKADEKKAPEKKDAKAAEAPKDGEKPKDAAADGKKEEKAAEGAEAAKPEPISYDFKYPEGFKPEMINGDRLTQFTSVLNESRVAPEAAQGLLDMHITELRDAVNKIEQNQWNVFNEQQLRYREEVLADDMVGGSRHETAMKSVMNFINEFGGPAEERQALFDMLKMTGAANSKFLLRTMCRAAESLTREGKPHAAPPPRSKKLTPQERGLKRYSGSTPAGNGAG